MSIIHLYLLFCSPIHIFNPKSGQSSSSYPLVGQGAHYVGQLSQLLYKKKFKILKNDWKMINHSTLDYHLINFYLINLDGSDGQMKTLNLYAGRNLNQNHNHDLNVVYNTHYRHKRAWPSGCSAFRPSARASKFILHANKLALQTKFSLVCRITLLARRTRPKS